MTADRIRTLLHAAPFAPFCVQLANGQRLPVPHPDFVSLSGTGRTIIINGKGEDFQVVDVMLITNIEVKPSKTKSARSERR